MRDLSRSIGRRGISAEITESFGVADSDIAFNFTARVARVSTAADAVAIAVVPAEGDGDLAVGIQLLPDY